jgi:hypothetical protein
VSQQKWGLVTYAAQQREVASPLEDSVSRIAARARSEFETCPVQSSGFLGGICALSVPCEGELVLWRIDALQGSYGHSELDGSVFQSTSLGEPQN